MAIDPYLSHRTPLLAQAQGQGTTAPGRARQTGPVFKIEEPKPASNTLANFETSVKEFQETLAKLPPHHKAEVRTIYEAVKVFAAKETAAGKKVERLSLFVGRVVEYCNGQLENIEKADPDLLRMKQEHQQLNDVFYRGAALINSLHAYVKDKDAP